MEFQLRPRELEVVLCVASGASKPEICNRLGVSLRTLDRHFTEITRKVGSPNHIVWLLKFGTWTPHETQPFSSLGRNAGRTYSAEQKYQPPARRQPRQHCGICEKYRVLKTVSVAGGLFCFEMCEECENRLDGAREEARQRINMQTDIDTQTQTDNEGNT